MMETERLRIREYSMDDFDALYELMSSQDTVQSYPALSDEERTRSFIEKNLESYAQYGFGLWAVSLKEDGEFIGDCGVSMQNIGGEMFPEIEYHIYKKFRKCGYEKEALWAVLSWMFQNTDYHMVYSCIKLTDMDSCSDTIFNDREYLDPENIGLHACTIGRKEWETLFLEKIKQRFLGISSAYKDLMGNVTMKCYGFADREGNVRVDENTVFPTNSISKFVTAICVMKEYEQGIIDIDKPVNHYLNTWKLFTLGGDESDASIRSLLCHTAGIVDGEDAFYGLRRNDPLVSLIDILEGRTSYNNRPVRAEKEQGTTFEYSDAGYCVLQLLLQEIVNKPFEDIARDFIFVPLGLKHTFFASSENVAHYENCGGMATGYDKNGAPIPGKYPQVPDLAAAGLWSTPKELMIIAEEFLNAFNGKSCLLKEESAREMVKPIENFTWTGLGVFMGGENEIKSQGWGENGQSVLKMNYSTGEITVVITNQDPGCDQSESGIEWLANRKAPL